MYRQALKYDHMNPDILYNVSIYKHLVNMLFSELNFNESVTHNSFYFIDGCIAFRARQICPSNGSI